MSRDNPHFGNPKTPLNPNNRKNVTYRYKSLGYLLYVAVLSPI